MFEKPATSHKLYYTTTGQSGEGGVGGGMHNMELLIYKDALPRYKALIRIIQTRL